MSKKIFLFSLMALAITFIASFSLVSYADTSQEYKTQGEVNFYAGGDTTGPVDPQEPNTPANPITPEGVFPTGPTTPDNGLTIVYASSFDFGNHQVSNKKEIYTASAQKIEGETDARSNYVQINDNRGSFEGWNLTVKMSDFITDNNDIPEDHRSLDGASLTLGQAEIQGDATAYPADYSSSTTTLTPGVMSEAIIGASKGHGSGTNLLNFGGKKGESKDSAITLSVPAGVAGAAKYTADLTWTLDITPLNT